MKIINLQNGKTDLDLLTRCAELYCEVWKEPPWNENFWEVPSVISDIKEQLAKKCASGFLTVNGEGCAVGFIWGYAVSKEEMGEISGDNRLDFLFENGQEIFYIDELGVCLIFRVRGIGKKLSLILISSAKKHGLKKIVLRTDKKAVAARELYRKLGFVELEVQDKNYMERTYWFREA